MKVTLDFETRSECDIWKSGAWEYASHPTTRILCIGFAVDDGAPTIVTEKEISATHIREFFEALIAARYIFVAHNAYFERAIWRNIMVKKYAYPDIHINQWLCTQAKGNAYGLPPSLEKAAAVLSLAEKDKQGQAIMIRMCKPLHNKKNKIIYDDDPEHYKILYEYCKQDVIVERELDLKTPDLIPQEVEVWNYDQVINTRGVRVDRELIGKIQDILKYKTHSLNAELCRLTDGKLTKGTQVVGMRKYLAKKGLDLPDINKETVANAIKQGTLNNHHLKVLKLRQQLGKSSLAKYERLDLCTRSDGILRDSFMYNRAITGRWGGQNVQLQNLPKGIKIDIEEVAKDILALDYGMLEMTYPNLMDVLSSMIRGTLIPNEGKELYVVDYAAIEARVLMWLANEALGLEEFEASDRGEGEDIYVRMAQRIYNDLSLTKKDNPDKRQLGKQAILGLGYGMGGKRFGVTCKGYGITIPEEEAIRITNLYRRTYSNVPSFWYMVENSMLNAFNNPNNVVICTRYIKMIYSLTHNCICIQLPSGRVIYYQQPKLVPNRFQGTSISYMAYVNEQWVRKETYGAHTVENICQAVARDLMAYTIPKLERAGFPVLTHVHDEIVSERPTGEGRIAEMASIMCDLPEWAKGCLIKAEGFTCNRYRK